jgi:hypothetical protein
MKNVPPVKIASVVYRQGMGKEKFIIFTEALGILIVLVLLMKDSCLIKGLRWQVLGLRHIQFVLGSQDLRAYICDLAPDI